MDLRFAWDEMSLEGIAFEQVAAALDMSTGAQDRKCGLDSHADCSRESAERK